MPCKAKIQYAYNTREKILPFDFAEQYIILYHIILYYIILGVAASDRCSTNNECYDYSDIHVDVYQRDTLDLYEQVSG